MQAFPVYNQRTDLELSTKGSALDVINCHLHLFRPLDRRRLDDQPRHLHQGRQDDTPADWDPEDFAGGPQSAMKNAKGETFGLHLGSRRHDHGRGALRPDRAGRPRMPKTFDDLIKVCDAVHNKEGVAAFTADKLHHWNWIPYLMGSGGAVFKAPPDNLTPTLDTPQAAGVGRVVRQPPDEVWARRHPVLFRRPGDALADVGPRQHPHPGHHLDGAAGQARRERGAEDRALRPDAGRAQGQLPRLQQPRARHPGRLQEEGSGVGVHQMGAVEGDHRHGRQEPRLSQRLPHVGDQEPGIQAGADPERPGRGGTVPGSAAARRQDRLHEVPHRAGLSAGRRQDQQGDRAHRHQAAGGTRGDEAGAGRGHPGPAEGRDQG